MCTARLLVMLVPVLALGACQDDAGLDQDGGGGGPAGDDAAPPAGDDAAPPGAPDATGAPADPCDGQAPACPAPPAGFGAGDGLRAIDRCAFPLVDRDTFAARRALVDALPASVPRVGLADVAADLNRVATRVSAAAVPGDAPGITAAFTWQSGDQTVAYWIPQGLTGSFDASAGGVVAGRKLLLVSWYYDQAKDPGSAARKGVRVAVVDVTDPDDVRYRFVLLVEPVLKNGRPDLAPVDLHAGGLAWVGDFLYVPQTGKGFRVFDLTRLLQLPTDKDQLGYDAATGNYYAHGYRYALPQVDHVDDVSSCAPVFSFVAVDRSTDPPSLISGEYDATSVNGRLYRWPLDPATGRLRTTASGRVIPDGAWFMGQSHVQGALSSAGQYWLSSSAPAGGAGALYRTAPDTPSTTYGWIDSPEDLALDPGAKQLWCLSEAAGARVVMRVATSAVD